MALAYSHGRLPWKPPEIDIHDEAYIARLPAVDAGLLFTMVAGLLNLLLIHDALCGVPGATLRRQEEERRRAAREALREELGGPAPDGAPPADEAGQATGGDVPVDAAPASGEAQA